MKWLERLKAKRKARRIRKKKYASRHINVVRHETMQTEHKAIKRRKRQRQISHASRRTNYRKAKGLKP